MLDKIFHTKNNIEALQSSGIETLRIIAITHVHIFLWIMTFFAYILAFISKNRFVNTSIILIIIGIFITYFGPNAGTPLFAKQSRLSEYLFFALTLLFIFYFFIFIYKPVNFIFKKYTKAVLLFLLYIAFFIFTTAAPSWYNTKIFWESVQSTEYTAIPYILLRINKQNRPFSWTVVSYVQEYAKIKDKGYHINTQDFINKYDPRRKYLKIPTEKVYLMVENFPHPYEGMREWFYRWRGKIQDDFRSWVAIYSMRHKNIKMYYKSPTITVYEIDNHNYIEYLRKKAKGK
jgi:hypothetical protein